MTDIVQDKVWVLAVQLYGVRSKRNWGHGDFTDLKNLIALAARVGAAGIGLNPLHALFDDRPEQASPYSPNSRLFLNTLYIDLEAVPEFREPTKEIAQAIARARDSDFIDYAAVAEAKTKALRLCFDRFRRSRSATRKSAFARFRAERGEALARFSAFEALRRQHEGVWWDWPEQDRKPNAETLARIRRKAAREVEFVEYIQWLADDQLGECQAEARRRGMPIGLYIDLAVGVEPGGADAWAEQDSIVQRVEVGAPPDLLNTAGQAWGLAAFDPRALVAQGFEPFRLLLESAMRHAGAIRLDHVLGLNRLYLIPFGCRPDEGAYVRYPLEAMLAVVAIESARHKCLVIGEDLGTVPENLSARLADWGIWSYLVLLFERREGGVFKQPGEYRANALATFSTHDLPTFTGWQTSHDLRVKRGLGLDPGETDDERDRAHWQFGEALAEADVTSGRQAEFADALRFIARTPSRFLVVQIEDVLDVRDQPNVPGTMTEHPNWRQKLPVALEALAEDPRLEALAQVLREESRAI
jgi:4-alpha-glucanotransferase